MSDPGAASSWSAATQGGERQRYRPDIDGLRAIAVASVVLFHAGVSPFNAGFVGVDIFFVISGYLIGGIILRSVAIGRFHFVDFYARRGRRILPALFVVVLAICGAGWFVLSAAEYRGVAETSMAALVATSNISFWQFQDYFNPDSRLSPLLMTWSLGVEEQFYVLFPILLIITTRWAPRGTVWVLGVLAVGFFVFSVWCTTAYPTAAFFLLPSRAWELLAGAVLAAWELRRSRRSIARDRAALLWPQVLGWFGLCALTVAVTCFDVSVPFPGFVALLPVAGTVALLASERSTVNRVLLSARPMVFVGMVSYSWYLWHWPLMSYVRIIAVDTPSTFLMVLTGGIAFVLAVLSWRFVEQPFRHARGESRRTLVRYGVALMAVVAITAIIKIGEGLPERLPQQVARVEATVLAGRGDCLAFFTADAPDTSAACAIAKADRPTLAVIGDSHAAALGPGLRKLAASENWGLDLFTKSSCGPFLNVIIPHEGMPFFAATCMRFMTKAYAMVAADTNVRAVVITAYWQDYRFLGAKDFADGLAGSIRMMKQSGKHALLVSDVPSWEIDPVHFELGRAIPVRGYLARWLWSDDTSRFPEAGLSSMTVPADPATTNMLVQVAGATGADWVDLRQRFCSPRGCLFEHNDDLLYLDHAHLSTFGSDFVLPVITPLIDSDFSISGRKLPDGG